MNKQHRDILGEGTEAWNEWRRQHPNIDPDLSNADLHGMELTQADLSRANLKGANLNGAELVQTNLSRAILSGIETRIMGAILSHSNLKGADLRRAELQNSDLTYADLSGHTTKLEGASLMGADLTHSDLSGAEANHIKINDARAWYAQFVGTKLRGAHFWGTDFREADFTSANLTGANLQNTNLVMTKFKGATLVDCKVFGISAWNVDLEGAIQHGLMINHPQEPSVSPILVDDLEVAQLIYLLLNNKKIRSVIDSITSKVVLILGRFSPERMRVLDAMRKELRKRGYLPVLFDFERPERRDLTETISTLAHMARFVIADITDAKAVPEELRAIVPSLPSLPIQPIILEGTEVYSVFGSLGGHLSVLPPFRYQNPDHLLHSLQEMVIGPPLAKAQEIAERRKAFEDSLGKGR